MALLVYLSGLILSFIMGRYLGRMMHEQGNMEYSWGWVILNVVICTTSWMGFIAFFIAFLMECEFKKPKIKIPKWL